MLRLSSLKVDELILLHQTVCYATIILLSDVYILGYQGNHSNLKVQEDRYVIYIISFVCSTVYVIDIASSHTNDGLFIDLHKSLHIILIIPLLPIIRNDPKNVLKYSTQPTL